MKKKIEFFYKKFSLWILPFLSTGLIPAISLLKIEENSSEKIMQKFQIRDSSKGEDIEISLDELLCGALAAEVPISFEPEALKAQVVAIHTYFLKQNSECSNGGRISLNSAKGKQIRNFSFFPEKKRREIWGKNFAKNELKIKFIVNQVKNKVLFFGNNLAFTFFFSWCYKKTNPCNFVFFQDLPYLKSVDSPEYESNLFPNLKITKIEIKKEEMKNILKSRFKSKKFSDKLDNTNPDEWIKISNGLDNGCIKELNILDEKVEGKDFRNMMDIKFTNLRISYNSDNKVFEIECLGCGHGVGMSQYGANYYAKQKMNCPQILAHYYPGTTLKEISI